MSICNTLKELLVMVKCSHHRLFGEIKDNLLLSKNIANLGIFGIS